MTFIPLQMPGYIYKETYKEKSLLDQKKNVVLCTDLFML